MRLPRFRFSLRRMMVAVAVAGSLAIGATVAAIILTNRAYRLAETAGRHELRHELLTNLIPDGTLRIDAAGRTEWFPSARARWHNDMARKYHEAARHPWLPVAPDPPEPE